MNFKVELLEKLKQHFSRDELREICFELEIDYENLSEKKDALARELIENVEYAGQTIDLLQICKNKRPHVEWPKWEEVTRIDIIEGFLELNIISSDVKAGAWNQGNPLSPLEFVVIFSVLNQSMDPIILTKFEISNFGVSHEHLKRFPPNGELFLNENVGPKRISVPYRIPGDYFGMFKYKINVRLDDRYRLNFDSDSGEFDNYKIEFVYEYFDKSHTTYSTLLTVEDKFHKFKAE